MVENPDITEKYEKCIKDLMKVNSEAERAKKELETCKNRVALFAISSFMGLAIIIILIYLYKTYLNSSSALNAAGVVLAIGITVAIIASISYWGSKKGHCPKWYEHPLGLPKGSIRAIIALLFVMTILLAANDYTNPVPTQNTSLSEKNGTTPLEEKNTKGLPDWLMGIVGTIIGFYFGERGSENKESAKKDGSNTDDVSKKLDLLKKIKDDIGEEKYKEKLDEILSKI